MNRNILLAISSGISAYKAYDLIRLFQNEDYQVRSAITERAEKFVSIQTLESLTGFPVGVSLWETWNQKPLHIALAQWSDIIVLFPATAHTIAILAHAMAPDIVSSTILAYDKSVIICPAMNNIMWQNQGVQENIQKLKNRKNIIILDPQEGYLACRSRGVGHIIDFEEVFQYVSEHLKKC